MTVKKNPPITCKRCLLSTENAEFISFDSTGFCNYCNYYDLVVRTLGSHEDKKRWIETKIQQIKTEGKDKPYDCVLGVSGGLDSSYLALWAKENGLRPLIVHFDNGWNSELAVKNIERLCTHLGYELNTVVVDWEEFKQLQLAYLRAGVVDIEALTDHAIHATIYRQALKHNIKYTLNGFNYASEAIMPDGWAYDKTDFINIRDINSKYGTCRIKTFPHISFVKRLWYFLFLKLESIRVLNYIDYDIQDAKKVLEEKVGWQDHGGKHYESVFTKFYQAHILPRKFHVDKRLAHLSNHICSGKITKEEAYRELQKPLFTPEQLDSEKQYVLKKLGLSNDEFERIMNEAPRRHTDFKTQHKLWVTYFKLLRILRPWKK
jgi:N-acetyl sugar amidotransferase